jgi:hypothetical protein
MDASGRYEDPNLRTDLHNAHMHPGPTTTTVEDPILARGAGETDPYVAPGGPVVSERTVAFDRPGPVERVTTEAPVERRRFSIGATLLGWSVATFFSLVFLSVVAAYLGGNALNEYYGGTDVGADLATYSIPALVGIVAATFLGWLIGGYAAGRIALWDGLKHGLAMIVWPIAFALLGWLVGTTMGDEFVRVTGVNFDFNQIADFAGMAILGLVLTLVAMLAGGALGGRIGERYHDRVHGIDTRERRRTVGGRRAL